MTPDFTDLIPQVRAPLQRAYPELSRALAAAIPAVCARHLREMRESFAVVAALSDDAVVDDLPEVLRALVVAYSAADGLELLSRVGPAHAAARVGQGFSSGEVFGEYVLLRRNFYEQVRGQLGRTPVEAEAEALQSGIDGVLASTFGSFVRQREGRLQLETNSLSDFLVSLAHDLRNEINGVLTTMTLIDELATDLAPTAAPASTPDDFGDRLNGLMGEVRACRHSMESSIAAMTRLLQAEQVRNRMQAVHKPIHLRTFLDGIARSADRLERLARPDQGGSRITVECAEETSLTTDPDLLSSILSNLVGNAVKYAPAGPIVLRAEGSSGGGRISVADHGPGLPGDQLEQLFEKFERGGRRDSAGLGLGLFVARRAAQLLGATIRAESVLGQGSVFIVELPLPVAK